jgi:hypothetical protein
MKCLELEALICDYVDGTLSAAEKATVELHLEGCAGCRELVEDSRAVVGFMEMAAEVEPPAALVNTILHEARQGKHAAVKPRGAQGWIGRLLEPVLQPKFAMGMAMTILSFAMLARFAGIPVRQMKPSDLEPAKVWATLEDKAYRSWDRAKKHYESLRLVFEIQQTLTDWNETSESQTSGAAPAGAKVPDRESPEPLALEGPIEVKPQGESGKKSIDGRARP